MDSYTKASEFAKCFHCGNLIYNISKLYEKENNEDSRIEHTMELEKIGGWDAVDKSWIEAIRKHLDLN